MHFTTTLILTTALALSTSALPNLTKRYASGDCRAHFQQYQKNEGPGFDTSVYRFSIELFDAKAEMIGLVNLVGVADGQSLDVDSALPAVYIATAGSVDQDPVGFAYNGFAFTSSSDNCQTGAYDSGSRQGDCGFPC